MSLLHEANQTLNESTIRRRPEYAAILVVICAALALLVADAMFAPAPVGSGISSEVWWVGP